MEGGNIDIDIEIKLYIVRNIDIDVEIKLYIEIIFKAV